MPDGAKGGGGQGGSSDPGGGAEVGDAEDIHGGLPGEGEMKVVQQETYDGKRLKFQVSTCQPIKIRFIPSRFTAELDLPGHEKPAGVKPNRIV